MATITFKKAVAIAAIAATASFGLAACATPAPEPTETAIGGDIVSPLEINYQDIKGQTIELQVGQAAIINYGGINAGEITVDISDPAVVEYSEAKMEGDAEMAAGLMALSGGESTVTFNFAGGDPKVLNVQVLLK